MQILPFKLERYFARYEFNVRHSLCSSDCESMEIGDLLALEPGAAERFQKHRLGYTESQGSPSLRREVCGLYTSIGPENVLVHAGAEEAIFLFMHAVLSAGDHVIVHSPCYQSLTEVPTALGCQVSRWTANEETGWGLDLEDLRRSLRPSTKVIVINTPHNPTGYLMSVERFRELHEIARERGIIVFSDEVYRELELSPEDRLPAACDLDERAVSLGVLSKTYGLPGLRIGWIATHNAEVYRKMAALKDYTTICNSAPSELLAEIALRHRQVLARRSLDIVERNLGILDGLFARHADKLAWHRPKAGPIAFPRLTLCDVESFCHELVERKGVLLLPGTVYEDRGNHFRIGFGRIDLPDAVELLEEFLSGWTVSS